MSAAPPIPRGAPPIHQRRCGRHPEREAAARCPSCGGYFCRECVVDHEGQLLCAPCLARKAAALGARASRWRVIRSRAWLVAAALAAVLIFYAFGSLLRGVPAEVHETSVWNQAAPDSP